MFYLNINVRIRTIDNSLKLVIAHLTHQSSALSQPFPTLHQKMMNLQFPTIWHLSFVRV